MQEKWKFKFCHLLNITVPLVYNQGSFRLVLISALEALVVPPRPLLAQLDVSLRNDHSINYRVDKFDWSALKMT